MSEQLSSEQIQNCRKNVEYMLKNIDPAFTIHSFTPQKFKDMTISQSTFKNVYYGKGLSKKTATILAASFSNYLEGHQYSLSDEDLLSDPSKFIQKYPKNIFIRNDSQSPSNFLELYANKIYRCYYMTPTVPQNAMMGYLKLQKRKNVLCAYFLRGIQDFDEVASLLPFFDDEKTLQEKILQLRHSSDDKSLKSLNLYYAENDHISYSENCIKIDFTSKEDVPCKSTLFWNINISNKARISYYIGGMALMVDTNDGLRGRDIHAFKIGLEENSLSEKPINRSSQYLINELMPDATCTVDNASDAKWYRFIQDNTHRQPQLQSYSPDDLLALTRKLLKLEAELTELLASQKNKD